jgi:hypothetical protein
MLRLLTLLALALVGAQSVPGQDWRPGGDLDLMRRAAARRAARDADSALATWHAEAHGVVRFAMLLDHAGSPIERVVRADELRVEVYGEAPSRSKQVITAWRDTTFLPNRMQYHRDHLGIVANDFGGRIRIGEGDEVADVPHPLSEAGLSRYRFAIGDTVLLQSPAGTVRVVAVRVRPAEASLAGIVGWLYLDVDRAEMVRMQFTFTPAAYRDPTVQDITVELENSLEEGRRWLPWHQAIAIRRGGTWLDLPYRTVIRGDWTIDAYDLGLAIPAARFAGPPVDGLRRPAPGGVWDGPLAARLGSLPGDAVDLAQLRREVSVVAGRRALEGLPRWRAGFGGIGDLIHANRVQGVTPGFGLRVGSASGTSLALHAEYGWSDHRLDGTIRLAHAVGPFEAHLEAGRIVSDIAERPVASRTLNTLAVIGDGTDFGDYVRLDRVMAGLEAGARDRLAVSVGWESSRDAITRFTPLSGSARANPSLSAGDAAVARVALARRDGTGQGWTLKGEVAAGDVGWGRIELDAEGSRPAGPGRLDLALRAGAGTRDLPGYRAWALGGRGTLPGVPFRAAGGRRAAWMDLAWMVPLALPTPPVPFVGHVALPSRLGPSLSLGTAGGALRGQPWPDSAQVELVVGVRAELWGPLLRLDAGYSPRRGTVAVIVDLHPDWWGLF